MGRNKRKKEQEKGQQNKKRKRSKGPSIFFILVMLVGALIMCYPAISNFLNNFTHLHEIDSYEEALDLLTAEEYARLKQEAFDYNIELSQTQGNVVLTPTNLVDRYESTLNFTGTGIIGHISVNKIGIKLPIYHGTSDSILEKGVGHLEGTSFPLPSGSSHAVLSAHTGLPTSELFTNIDTLEIGDRFTISILGDNYTYEIDDINVVLPYETEKLYIQPGRDLVTLMTCTPYGVNSHRLLVTGHYVDGVDEAGVYGELAGMMLPDFLLLSAVVLGLALIIVVLIRRGLAPRWIRKHTPRYSLMRLKIPDQYHSYIGDAASYTLSMRDDRNRRL